MADIFQLVRGMHDILPDEQNFFTIVKKAVRHRCRQSGFRRISTPILEDSEIFLRGIGENTDLVEKEMYFVQSGEKKLALKPESTAGICRSFLEHGMQSWPQPVQFYYFEPHFRHDRPQKNRFRQFWQFGVEVLGARDVSIDAQVILLATKILDDLKILDRFSLQINSIGSHESRKNFESELQNFFLGRERGLCNDCRNRIHKNPMRILDCKNEDCQILSKLAPKISDFLDNDSKKFFQELKKILENLGIKFHENPNLVRGLDYYCDTVFEFWDKSLGAQNAVGGGGRYDYLIETLGGTKTPGFGFAFGVERIVSHLKNSEILPPQKDQIDIFVAAIGENAKIEAIKILDKFHDKGIHAIGAMGKNSMRSQLKMADKFGAKFAILIGEIEVREKTVILRNMEKGAQKIIPATKILSAIAEEIDPKNFDLWKIGE